MKLLIVFGLILGLATMGATKDYVLPDTSYTAENAPTCDGTKVYWKDGSTVITTGCTHCRVWICEQTGVEGSDCTNICINYSKEQDNSYFESLREKFRKGIK